MRQTDGRTKGREAVRKAAYLWAGTQCANQKQDRMTLTSKELSYRKEIARQLRTQYVEGI